MLHFNSFVRGMSVQHSPFAHISNNYSRQPIFTNLLKKTSNPKLTLGCSVLPIEVLKISVDDDGETEEYNESKASGVDSVPDYLNGLNVNGVVNVDSLKSLNKKVLKERMRRIRIGLANKGRVPWNKGRKHTPETRERIRIRTSEALRDPKVKKKMAEQPRYHSDQIKAKISYSLKRVWQKRLKSKRLGELFFLQWEHNIANVAKKGVNGQEELDWDSYDKIKEQLEFQQVLQAEEKEKQKMMALAGAEKFIQSWMENIAKEAKKGGSGEQELEWDSYKKIEEEMVLLNRLRRTNEKAKVREMEKIRAEKEARIKALKRVMLTQKRKDQREWSKARGNTKSQPYKNIKEGKGTSDVTQEIKLGSKLPQNHASNDISGEVARERDLIYSIFPAHSKLDLELIKREKMQKEVSLAEQIQAAKLRKGKLN